MSDLIRREAVERMIKNTFADYQWEYDSLLSKLENISPVEAVPLSMIEKIELKLQSEISRMEEIEKTCDYKRPHTLDWVLKLIKDEVSEVTKHENM